MYVVQPANVERFKSFCEQLAEFTRDLAAEKNITEKAMNTLEAQHQEGEAAFAERVTEDKEKFAAQREILERDLRKLTALDDKLMAQKQEWAAKQAEAHLELMKQLDNEELASADAAFCDQFGGLIDSMNNLSYQSMNDQFVVLKDNLDALEIEKNQLEISIADQSSTISSMSQSLEPTCGVTHKERNALRIILQNEVTKVRTAYQTSRLHEESLKAKLST